MPLVSERYLLSLAEEKNFAVPGFFPFNLDFLRVIMEVCEEERSPVIICQGPEFIESFGERLFTEACKIAAEYSSVPMALSVDHTFVTDESTVNKLAHTINLGWDAVMLDGSLLPYEENVRLTKKMVEICREKGANCTGALGEVRRFFPQAQMYKGPFEESFTVPAEIMTDPQQAKDFIDRTGIDVLAVSAGQYIRSLWDGEKPPFKKTGRLDIERIKKIKELTNSHLILMGSTHVNEDDLALAARSGVNMIKVASEYALLWSDEIRRLLEEDKNVMFPEDIQKPGLAAVKESMRRFIRIFNSNNQV